MSSAEANSRNSTMHPALPLIFPLQDLSKSDAQAAIKKVDPDTAWHFYSHSIRRNPNDLALHTHRVFFAMQHKDAELLAGSLHDLFYVLKDAGTQLRIRLLKASMPYLDKKDTLYFAMWIKTGIKKGMGYKWVPGSVLSDGLHGPDHTLIHIEKDDSEDAKLSPLEEARSCMEFGQLDVAKKILQEALAEDSYNKQLLEELDYLEQYSKSREIQPEVEPKKPFGSALKKLKEQIFS
ncbi:hypothetical protein OO007_02765 [Cocleimonas sp. KMM 6892]|uniref:hypothetical protein n=1 Tax=unclassified Cocleimonas TaxID=2639732 RepID=UPI002DBBC121|nr:MULTISPECIES: hypothetical protein [unclassified Cocleimonas]MEB8431134.1 hypothetical protein [Cocleimonas sp. KMM 6892]MEC4714094.1 hypothetical protein [Cocleimonas sp. KMM 6895]MEC4743425.1 hypothetical protein [Cocleimonas sp. KMM 6896]